MDRERDALGIEGMTYTADGLIPAIVQQHDTGEVLMLAYMNADSLAKTLETGYTWFWSRSRQKYWQKGESSGHVQRVIEVRYDCDADTLLVLVDQVGPGACHTGERSCFYRTLGESHAAPGLGAVLGGLAAVLEERKRELPEGSYTTQLLSGPQDKLLKKIAEESGEVIIAARDNDRAQLTYEAADLLYHLLVVLTREGVSAADLAAELDSRRK
ncbi:MAG: bifunctional phosphoribosyl-AMP cyclohydrolase/phosphoribosyl-ATP diphosphatase HisIE [Aeromicrobium sp.]|jgi:phosphoribosyl-ATP pyrophosphohydrolase/phosphoribosyl-AMP cyclohydrolase|nr:bifunctional phosphoribosyl-AMP cyclohydrolase/phosphoribosyl-ATP diphosphatase HisIE [Aeromicrobium sp.]